MLSIKANLASNLRSFAVQVAAPTWLREKKQKKSSVKEKLLLENIHLKQEIVELRDLLLSDQINHQICGTLAKVIFREPSSWSSTIWINIGEDTNSKLGKIVVAENSPILKEKAIVGVVEYVGKVQSRVRLITDAGVIPSVRVSRGLLQNKYLFEWVDLVHQSINTRDDLFEFSEEKQLIQNVLCKIKSTLSKEEKTLYLAKGELYGSSAPLFRSRNQILKGVGFNYDFADSEGPACDLRKNSPIPLIKKGDLLVTTGLDGVFPSGYQVGIVSHVEPLKEGEIAYELEARIAAGNLDELNYVTVLPSIIPLEK